ncbi:hypothetical protein PZA11_007435 [Diplocarpon coronariae]
MSLLSLFRNPGVLGAFNVTTLLGIGTSTYLLRSHMIELSEDHEARMDELEGTLRGHIGLIEEALDRLEGKGTEADRGKKMNGYYGKRARDDKAK